MKMYSFRPALLAALFASLTFANSIRAAIPPAETSLPSDTLPRRTRRIAPRSAPRYTSRRSGFCGRPRDEAVSRQFDRQVARIVRRAAERDSA